MTDYTNLYFAHPVSNSRLMELGFIPSSTRDGNNTCTYYECRFPVCYWKRKTGQYSPTLFCTLTLNTETWHVLADVKTLDNNYYAAFYSQEYGGYQPLLGEIHRRINKKLDEFHIVDGNKKKRRSKNDDESRSKENRRPNSRSRESNQTASKRRESQRYTRSRTKVSWKNV